MDVPYEIGRIDGRLDSQGEEIGGIRGQLGEIHGMVGGINERLDRLLGSGPHPIIVAAQEPTERKTETFFGRINHLLMNPKILHILYPLLALLALAMILSFWSGRPASDFLRFDQSGSRSTIGPLDTPSGKPVTREGGG